MRISARLSFSMWLLMILVVSLGIYNVQYSHSIDKPFGDVARSSRNRAVWLTMQKDMVQVRRDVWQGLVTSNPENWQTADNRLLTIQSQFDSLKKTVIIPERQVILQKMEVMFKEYLTLYARMKDFKAQRVPLDREDFRDAILQGNQNATALEEQGRQVAVSYEQYAEQSIANYEVLMHDFRIGSLGIALLSVLLAIAVWYITYRSIVPPIKNMTHAMDALARWDLSVSIPQSAYHDEIEAMGKAVEVFKANALKLEAIHQDLKRVTVSAGAERKDALRSMADKFEDSVKDVAVIMSLSVKEMKMTAQSLSSVAEETSKKIATTSSEPEASSFLAALSKQVSETARIATEASEKAARTNDIVRILSDAATKIGCVVIMINDIATQTDRLAANATLEADQAGGRAGSYSIAGSMKDLANRTALASWTIGDQVKIVREETRRAIEAIREVGSTIDTIKEISSSIASAVGEKETTSKV